jgi:hypothetical protein
MLLLVHAVSVVSFSQTDDVYLTGRNFFYRDPNLAIRFTINGTTGNTGVGLANPTGGLDVRSTNGSIVADGLYFYNSGYHSDNLPVARLVQNWGMRYSSPSPHHFFSSGPSVLIGYEPNTPEWVGGTQWGKGNLLVQGNVGIGTTQINEYKLSVAGKIRAKEVKVTVQNWGDYVFSKEYRLRSLAEVEEYIGQYGHLPEVPSAEEVEREGVEVGQMETTIIKKIEELTLYLIELKRDNERLQQKVEKLESNR